MVAQWPSRLPLGIKYGALLELGGFGSKLITDMESGNKRRRRRFENKRATISVTINLDDSELDAFKSFYHYELFEGTKPFEAEVLDGGSIATLRCEFTDETVRLEATTYNFWTISFNLDILNIRYIPFQVIEFWDQFGYDVLDWENWLEQITNIDFPLIMVFGNGFPYIVSTQAIPSLLIIDFTSGGNGLITVRWYQNSGSEFTGDPNDFLTNTSPVSKAIKNAAGNDVTVTDIQVDHTALGVPLGMLVDASDDITLNLSLFPWNNGSGVMKLNGSTVTPIPSPIVLRP